MDRPRPEEAPLVQTEGGLRPQGDGWYVLNVADAFALAADGNGHSFFLGTRETFRTYGLNVSVLQPGEVSSLYHAESNQEDFLVLFGECLALIEGQERTLRQWDFFHAAPWTEHTFVGAGDGPCAILMIGGNHPEQRIVYPVEEVAARHRASVERETDKPDEAYGSMGWQEPTPARPPWPPR